MNRTKWAFGTALLALSLMVSGCAKKESAAEKQLAETQMQLEEANKKLEGAGMQPVAPPPASVAGKASSGSTAAYAEKGTSALQTSRSGWNETKPAPSGPVTHSIPAGTPITVRTAGKISTKTSASGSTFEANLNQAIEVNGYIVAPRGAAVEGVVLNSDPGGRVKGVASITVGLRRIVLADGRSLAVTTNSRGAQANPSKGKDAAKIGIASGIGAAIGAIAGGGRGAAIGAGAGAAGGTGLVLGTRGSPAEIPAESVLTFKLAAPVSVQELKR